MDRLALIRAALEVIADVDELTRRPVSTAEHVPSWDNQSGLAVRALCGLAAIMRLETRFDQDERALVVAAFDAALGHDFNEMAVSASQLASLLNATDRSEEAVELYRRVLRIRQEQFGADHPTVVSTLHNLALACDAAGRSEEAQILWDEARAALESTKQATP